MTTDVSASETTLDALVEQARQCLVLDLGPISERQGNSDWCDWIDPVPQRLITDTMALLEGLRAEGLPEGLQTSPCPEYINDDGRQAYADLTDATPDKLRRVAAHALVAYALLRQEAEKQMVAAWIALDMAEENA